MTGGPLWAEAVAAVLLVTSGVFVMISAFGFVFLRDFFLRMHPPALAYTLGSWSVAIAGVVTFSLLDSSLELHPWLVMALLAVTVPVTTVLLARAALFRQRQARAPDVPALLGRRGPRRGPVT